MSDTRFVLDIAYSALMAVLYGAVAWAVSRRKVSAQTELASLAFINWWGGLSAFSVIGIVAAFVSHEQAWTLVGFLTYLDLVLVLLIFILMSLMYYFVFLFTGSQRATGFVIAFYIAFLGFWFYFVNAQQPVGLMYENNQVVLDYANDLSETPLALWSGLLLLAPLVLGALAYTSLYFRVEDRTQRFRIITVGLSIFIWMLTALGVSLGGVDETSLSWTMISRAVAVLATSANYVAFRPPKWLQDKLGLRPVTQQSS